MKTFFKAMLVIFFLLGGFILLGAYPKILEAVMLLIFIAVVVFILKNIFKLSNMVTVILVVIAVLSFSGWAFAPQVSEAAQVVSAANSAATVQAGISPPMMLLGIIILGLVFLGGRKSRNKGD